MRKKLELGWYISVIAAILLIALVIIANASTRLGDYIEMGIGALTLFFVWNIWWSIYEKDNEHI